ncbi:MAG: hypothetical protein K2O89_06580 [Clostridia bacterium]|nr:hypothetical protein [Clostridia bacterium]
MRTAIENIYYGTANKELFSISNEYKIISERVNKLQKDFYASLNEEQKKLYDQINDLQLSQHSQTFLQNFKEGFKLGLSLAAEAILK